MKENARGEKRQGQERKHHMLQKKTQVLYDLQNDFRRAHDLWPARPKIEIGSPLYRSPY